MAESKNINRDDLRSVLFILVLFVSVVGGRELGAYYSSYEEMTQLKVFFEVEEEELSRYLISSIEGVETPLTIGYSITSKNADNTIDLVPTQPDYVRRWMIGLTVSPIKVNQPEASDVDFEIAFAKENWTEALIACEKSLEIYQNRGYRWRWARKLIDLGDAHIGRNEPGDLDRARETYQQSLDMFTEMGAPGYIQVLEERLKDIGY